MNVRYIMVLMLSILAVQPMCLYPKKKKSAPITNSAERKVRGELDKLMRKDRARLTFAEMKRIRELIKQLEGFNKEDASRMAEDLTVTCCIGLSEFEEHEVRAELHDLFKNAVKDNPRWVNRVEGLLLTLYNSILDNFESCVEGEDEEENKVLRENQLKPYRELAHHYEKIMGKKYTPERIEEYRIIE